MTRLTGALLAAVVIVVCEGDGARAQTRSALPAGSAESSGITTTLHPPLPAHPSLYWLVPDASASARAGRQPPSAGFARGAARIDMGDFAAGLSLVTGADLRSTPLGPYSRYYTGVALLGLGRLDEAEAAFAAIEGGVAGYLEEAVPLRRAEVALARGDPGAAAGILDVLSRGTLTAPEEVLLRLGVALEAAGDPARALKAYTRVYYEFPLSSQAAVAQDAITRLQTPALVPANRVQLELGRAERLFAAALWAQAGAAYASLVPSVSSDDRALVSLRLAECDYHLGRYRAARDGLRPHLGDGPREAEARFFHLTATRALRDHDAYVRLARGLVADHPDSTWAEDALDSLASHYITLDEEEEADRVFRELVRRFPRGRHGDRAAWKIGWRAYKHDAFEETARTFEAAAGTFPRADYRPSWLYWAARSRDQLGEGAAAHRLYQVLASDYQNSYYGRLAAGVLAERRQPPVEPIVATLGPATPGSRLVPTDGVIRALVASELDEAALHEVEYARRAWGDSPALQATVAWIRHRRGLQGRSEDRFADMRGAITIMRRAYPQFMAAGGERLPADILHVIFPLDYWPLITKYSDTHHLDPFLMAALIAQESTFTPDVRSAANAVGLMQLIPATARRYAARLGLRYSSRMLTQPETNIRLGMRYFRDLMDRFGGAHYALASYNAGERRVALWIAERRGFAQDEFIDDIPFPETQNYVKRILGTADDYRRLYGGGMPITTSATR